jgi:Tol biopolymer transport system component
MLAGCLGPSTRNKHVVQPPSWLVIRPDFTPQVAPSNPTPEPTPPPRAAEGLPDPTWETAGIAPWVTPVAPEGALNAEISPDGRTLVYWAYHPGTSYASFYQASTGGGTPVRLNDQVADQVVYTAQFSAGSRAVVFNAQRGGVDGLYSRGLTATTTITLTSGLVWDFALTPDGQTVIYMPDTQSREGGGLWRVPVSGGAPQRLGGEIGLEGPFQISPDGRRLAAYARRGESLEEGHDLYILPIDHAPSDSSAAVRVAARYLWRARGEHFAFAFSPDSRQVIWLDPYGEAAGLYAMPVEGGKPRRVDAGDLPVIDFAVTHDGRYVVYRAGYWRDHPEHGAFSVPLAGGTPLRLHARLAAGEYIGGPYLSPDGRWVSYDVITDGSAGPPMTYVQPASGGTAITLTAITRHFSPDSRWLIYTQDEPEPGLYSQFLDGGSPIRLNPPLPAGYEIDWSQVGPDSRYVLYSLSPGMRASMPIEEGLYLVPIGGGPAVELTGTAGSGRQAFGLFLPDGRTILLYADYDGDGAQALYTLDLGDDIPRSTGAPP